MAKIKLFCHLGQRCRALPTPIPTLLVRLQANKGELALARAGAIVLILFSMGSHKPPPPFGRAELVLVIAATLRRTLGIPASRAAPAAEALLHAFREHGLRIFRRRHASGPTRDSNS